MHDSRILTRGLTIVVPVYNSSESLGPLVAEIERVLSASAVARELILVNDGSRDDSWAGIESLCAEKDWLRGINLTRNFGQHNALLCGIREARFSTTVTIDDDLQHPPAEIPVLLARLEEGFDVVYGAPERQQHGFLRNLASRLTKRVLRGAIGAETASRMSAFRAFRTRLREAFADYRSPLVSIDVLLTWATTSFSSVTVAHEPRRYGQSNYTVRKLLAHAFNMMTGFSILPLRLATYTGFCFTVFGLLILAYVVGRYLIERTSVPGFPFLASVIAIFSGAQLFALGIFGEYLGRIHVRTLDRPAYLVRKRVGEADPEEAPGTGPDDTEASG